MFPNFIDFPVDEDDVDHGELEGTHKNLTDMDHFLEGLRYSRKQKSEVCVRKKICVLQQEVIDLTVRVVKYW